MPSLYERAAQMVGGDEALTELLKNSHRFLSNDQIDAVNKLLESPDTFERAITSLVAAREVFAASNPAAVPTRSRPAVDYRDLAHSDPTVMEAALAAGGFDRLNDLMNRAPEMVNAGEAESFNERLSGDYGPSAVVKAIDELARRDASRQTGQAAPATHTGPASGPEEFNRLMREAGEGNIAARARVDATTPEVITSWLSN